VLTRQSWESAELREIIETALEPFTSSAKRLSVAGPHVRLAPGEALALSMAIHELATNATKFGALSNESGGVRIVWETRREPRAGGFRLSWSESGGPPVVAPTRRGFGTRLIADNLASQMGAKVTLAYGPEGLTCVIEREAASGETR
jgi:two-component sensor histidine kinase